MIKTLNALETASIYAGPRFIPLETARAIDATVEAGTPLVDPDIFSGRIAMFIAEKGPDGPARTTTEAQRQTFDHHVALGACSLELATLHAGDIFIARPRRPSDTHIPRPRRLHEHNQSSVNIHDAFFATRFTDPRDRVLAPTHLFKDTGKSLCVALNFDAHEPSRGQDVHNMRVTKNLLSCIAPEVLSSDEKRVIELLVHESSIGKALIHYAEKNRPFDEVLAKAEAGLNELRSLCPDDYRDRFDEYLIASYLTDAAAHTERAYYIDAATGEVTQDVQWHDRYKPDGSERNMTLDRLFSEAPEDAAVLKLRNPKHLEMMRALFPNHY